MRKTDWSKVLGWPGCRLYSREINDWRRRSSCGCGASVEIENWCAQGAEASFTAVYDSYEREVRDLPCFQYQTTVAVEL